MKTDQLSNLRDALRVFAKKREWDQFHSPKNLAIALSVEAAELLEHFQWRTGNEQALDLATREKVAEEIQENTQWRNQEETVRNTPSCSP